MRRKSPHPCYKKARVHVANKFTSVWLGDPHPCGRKPRYRVGIRCSCIQESVQAKVRVLRDTISKRTPKDLDVPLLLILKEEETAAPALVRSAHMLSTQQHGRPNKRSFDLQATGVGNCDGQRDALARTHYGRISYHRWTEKSSLWARVRPRGTAQTRFCM